MYHATRPMCLYMLRAEPKPAAPRTPQGTGSSPMSPWSATWSVLGAAARSSCWALAVVGGTTLPPPTMEEGRLYWVSRHGIVRTIRAAGRQKGCLYIMKVGCELRPNAPWYCTNTVPLQAEDLCYIFAACMLGMSIG